jgi:gamma-glutamylcysteine synthetase
VITNRRTLADELLLHWHGAWKGSVDPVFREYAF